MLPAVGEDVADRDPLALVHGQVPARLDRDPVGNVAAAEARVRWQPLLRPLGALGPVGLARYGAQRPAVADIVGERRALLAVPVVAAAAIGFLQRHDMVDVEPAGFGDLLVGIGIVPASGQDPAAIRGELRRLLGIADQHGLAGVDAASLLDPVWPVL